MTFCTCSSARSSTHTNATCTTNTTSPDCTFNTVSLHRAVTGLLHQPIARLFHLLPDGRYITGFQHSPWPGECKPSTGLTTARHQACQPSPCDIHATSGLYTTPLPSSSRPGRRPSPCSSHRQSRQHSATCASLDISAMAIQAQNLAQQVHSWSRTKLRRKISLTSKFYDVEFCRHCRFVCHRHAT